MSEPAQTTLTLHSSLAAFVLLLIAALLVLAVFLGFGVVCLCLVRFVSRGSLCLVRSVFVHILPASLS